MNIVKGAAILCAKPKFRAFLSELMGWQVVSEDDAAAAVRAHCQIESRREFRANSRAAQAWKDLVEQFNDWANQS